MNCKILLCSLVVLFIAGIMFFYMRRQENYENPSKCFDCEAQMERMHGPGTAWMGQQTKCFSCEREMYNRTGDIRAPGWTHPAKLFSVSNQGDSPYKLISES